MDVVGEFWFSVRQGEALPAKTFTFTEAGTPIVLTAPFMQGARRNAPSDRIDFAPTAGGNVITVELTPEQTVAMTPGDYLWDLFATGPDGKVLDRLEGVFEVVATVSRPA